MSKITELPEAKTDSTYTFANISQPQQIMWNPKEDITAYELAMCLPIILGVSFGNRVNIDESQSYARHFKSE